jgi:hypothetical protein
MLMKLLRSLAFGLVLVAASAVEAAAQSGSYPSVRLGGRVQAQYAYSSVDAARNDFFLRRVRLRADVDVNDWISGRVQPDFAGGGASLQDGYVAFAFSEGFNVQVGQFKRPFDLFDLSSSTDLSIIERDGRVEGVDNCPGVGGVCSHTGILEDLLFAGRDQGVMVEGEAGQLSYAAMLSNGQGNNVADVNDGKSFSARVMVAVNEDFRIGGKLGVHDYLDPTTATQQAVAYGLDAEWGDWRNGFHAQLTVVAGDNWRRLDLAGDPVSFLTTHGWASYYHPLEGARVVAVEPVLRVGFGDADRDVADDGGMTLTPGLMFYFGGRNKFGANFDLYRPQTGDSEYSLKFQTYLYF